MITYLVTPSGDPPKVCYYGLTIVHIISRMDELGIDKDGSVCFGQLLGMCDHVSLTLGELSLDFTFT